MHMIAVFVKFIYLDSNKFKWIGVFYCIRLFTKTIKYVVLSGLKTQTFPIYCSKP